MRNRELITLLVCFVFITGVSLAEVISIPGEEDEDYNPDLVLDFFVPIGEKETPAKNRIEAIIEKFIVPRDDRVEERIAPVNLIGTCPPMEGDYQCPMVPQETERRLFNWPLSGSEGETERSE